MQPSIRVAVLDDYLRVAATMADWAGRLPHCEVVHFHEHLGRVADVVAALSDFDVVVAMRERTPFPREVLERLTRLRLLVTTGMRNAAIDVEAAHRLGVTVCGTRAHPASTAELTWALILALFRHVARDDAALREGVWQTALGLDLDGEILGVVGLGRQGGRVARIGQAFGMRVIAWSPHMTQERAAEHGATAVDKEELFATARVVTLHMPAHPSTYGLVGSAELDAMRSDAFLVNTSRASLVDQEALSAALHEGGIAGLATDVYDAEPLPDGHWLRGAPRVLLSPHMGYVSVRNYEIFYGDAVEDIAAHLAGAPVRVL